MAKKTPAKNKTKPPAKPKAAPKKTPVPKTTTFERKGGWQGAWRPGGDTREARDARRPLPSSLATWLAYDDPSIVTKGKLAWRSFSELVAHDFDPELAAMCADFEKLLTGQCLAFSEGSMRW